MDVVDKATRSKIMSKIKGKNTRPEMIVRKFLHANGYRFRLHRKDLPGNPDIVLPKLRVCIFVHGCFWHLHKNCKFSTLPKTRPEYWLEKLTKNTERDSKNESRLQQAGWTVLTIWECDLDKGSLVLDSLLTVLNSIKRASRSDSIS
ncbi:MAG TPA: DNA mismatch endonuclease Vsr [Pseudomonas sp.]|uniref:very short patch repair endonuclease n=1 Tax=Pseudomonas sp. TaxID=306 RepID=UPI002C2330B8|nr:DNA mismatch endonuclease Vsr [Pseudomonas sp.]HWH86820.1 DNA mismatch endonuclease Vsr [Pseudomonas sp.]